MNSILQEILLALTPLNEGLTHEALSAREQDAGFALPPDYREFFLMANGASGTIGKSGWLHLYSIEEVVEGRDAYSDLIPAFIQIGSNGGSTGYFWNCDPAASPDHQFVQFDLYDLDIDAVEFAAPSFFDFIVHLQDTQYY